jgi:hypothetical protein
VHDSVESSSKNYTLTFKSCGRNCCNGPNKINVLVNDAIVYSFTPDYSWSQFQVTFPVINSGPNKITFEGTFGTFDTTLGDSSSAICCVALDGEAYTQLTDSNIKTAAQLWVSNQASAASTYGLVHTWDTTQVTSLANVWCGYDATNCGSAYLAMRSFNGDISMWDVSKITTMYWSKSKLVRYLFMNSTAFSCPTFMRAAHLSLRT